MKLRKLLDKLEKITPLYLYTFFFFTGFLVFANSLFNGFVWDDEEQIVNNAVIQHLSNFGQIFSGATFGTGGAGLSGWFFRPFLTLSYMLSFAVFGQNAFGYHLLQFALHLAVGFLIFKILQKLINPSQNKTAQTLNLLVATFFVVHPAVTEAVDYIASSHYVWMTVLDLLAFLIIVSSQKHVSIKKYIAASLLLLSAALFNESAVAMFSVLGVFLFLYKRNSWKKWLFTLAATLVGYLVLRLGVVHTPFRHPQFAPISEASLPVRITTIPKEFLSYLHVIFYPNKLAISQHFLVASFKSSSFYFPLLLDLIFISAVLFLSLKFKSKLILFGFLWFLLGFSVVSNIIPIDMTIAQRWIYFPFVGFIFMLAAVLHEFSKQLKDKTAILVLAMLILIAVFGIRTIVRNSNWQNGLTLYSHDIKISKNSFDLENNLGVELFRISDYKNAKVHFERSIELSPKWYFAYNNLGAVYQREGNLEKATTLYEKTLSLSDYYLSYENLAAIKLQTQKPEDVILFLKNALSKLPYNAVLNQAAAIEYYKINATDSAKLYAQRAYALLPSEENRIMLQKISSGQSL